MDPKSGSLGLEKLIAKGRQYQNIVTSGNSNAILGNVYYNHTYSLPSISDHDSIESRRLIRQIAEENEEFDVNVSILQELQSVFNEQSANFPSYVKAALKSCITRQSSLTQCREELSREEVPAEAHQDAYSTKSLKQYQISLLEASHAFRRSVLLLRQLVLGSQSGHTSFVFNGDHTLSGAQPAAKEGEVLVGPVRIGPLRSSTLTVVNNGDFGTDSSRRNQDSAALTRNLAQAVSAVLATWSITFAAGVHEGGAKWYACRALTDTGCNGNWVKRDILERSHLEHKIEDVADMPMVVEDASNNIHVAAEVITLTWYRNEEAESNLTDFFVIDSGPYEMIFGKEFVHERLVREFGEDFASENLAEEEQPKTILPHRLRRMTSAESRDYVQSKLRRNAEKKAEEARRQAEKRQILIDNRNSSAVLSSSTTQSSQSS